MKTRSFIQRLGLATAPVLGAFLMATPERASSAPVLDLWDTCSTAGQPCSSTLQSVFTVDQDGGFVARGILGIGTIPATGPGERTMWYPYKGAFRTGSAGGSGTTAWDDANVGFYSFAGGYQTRASAYASFAFGDQVVVSGTDAAGFGASHTVSGTVGFATGAYSTCSGFACVAMGYYNRATGQGTVAIGYRTIAGSDYSVALGHRATSCFGTNINALINQDCPDGSRQGTFTFADYSTTTYLGATANNQFNSRAAGGYRLFTNASATAGVTMNAGGSAWNVVSDRDAKEHFADYDGEALLQRIALLPIHTWRYIAEEDASIRHIGPTAQDWQALVSGPLSLNNETITINQGDYDGVNLAAIKALTERTRKLDAENTELRAQLEAFSTDHLALSAELTQLRLMVAELASDRREAAIASQP